MKKGLWGWGVALAIALWSSTAFADINAQGGDIGPPNELTVTHCNKSNWNSGTCNALLGGGTQVVGMKHVNVNANSCMSLFDRTTVPSNATTSVKVEICEATALDGALHIFPSSLLFTTSVSVWCGNVGNTDNSDCEVWTK